MRVLILFATNVVTGNEEADIGDRLLWAGVALLMMGLALFIVGRVIWAGTLIYQPTTAQLAVGYGSIGFGGLGFALIVLGAIGKALRMRTGDETSSR